MIDAGLQIRETPTGLEVRLHVLPRAKRCEISGVYNGALKVRVTAPPVDDAANRAIVDFFSALLDVSRSSLSILAGLRSRDKVLKIRGLSLRSFLEQLERGKS
jgi:uncharacterized protein (TIGR00251 family)